MNTGIFIGFHGRFSSGGTNNEENPVVYVNPATGAYFHFILGQQPGIGHLDGLFTTTDSLFIADLCTNGNAGAGAGAGVIYQVKALVAPVPPNLTAQSGPSMLTLAWDRGVLQEAADAAGPWSDVVDAFSPQAVLASAERRFYRVRF